MQSSWTPVKSEGALTASGQLGGDTTADETRAGCDSTAGCKEQLMR